MKNLNNSENAAIVPAWAARYFGFLPKSWLDLMFRLSLAMQRDYLGLIAAGIAFYILLAVFPALGAVISLYGLFSDPHFVADQLNMLQSFLPKDSFDIVASQAQAIINAPHKSLGFSLIISILLSIYSSTKGMNAMIQGFNVAYDEQEKRGFVGLTLTCFTLTFVMMVYFLAAISLIAGLPALLQFIYVPDSLQNILLLARWPALFVVAVVGLQILYYFGPSRPRARWHWITPGSVTATILWLVLSSLFSLFVTHFGQYNKTYGSLSAVVVLLLWFWVSALMILLGAEINAIRSARGATAPSPA